MAHVQKLNISEKSTIFVQSLWNLVKMITSWGNYFHQVSWELDKIVDFFLMLIFLTCPIFFLLIFYKNFVEVIKNITDHFRRIWIQDILIIFGRIGHYWDFFWPRCAGCGPVSLSLFFSVPFASPGWTRFQDKPVYRKILHAGSTCMQDHRMCNAILWTVQSCVLDNPVGRTILCAGQSCGLDNPVCSTILFAGQYCVQENPVCRAILSTWTPCV